MHFSDLFFTLFYAVNVSVFFMSVFFSLLPMRMVSVSLLIYKLQHNLIQNGDGNEQTGDISV